MKIRSHLESLPPYIPIEPFEVISAHIGRAPSQIVKLDANENPYGPLIVVREVLGKLDYPHIYPDPESRALRTSLANFTGVSLEYLLAGSGAAPDCARKDAGLPRCRTESLDLRSQHAHSGQQTDCLGQFGKLGCRASLNAGKAVPASYV